MPRPETPLTLLEACAVINLYATRWMRAILAAVEGPVAIADVVAREAQFVWRGGTGEDARERDVVELQPFLDDGLLRVISTGDEDELLTFIDLTLVIDAGEAMTAALAIQRGCIVVTDDRKASRVLTERGVRLRNSLELIQHWSTGSALSREGLRTVLSDLRQRGNYVPPRGHALRGWWDEVLDLE